MAKINISVLKTVIFSSLVSSIVTSLLFIVVEIDYDSITKLLQSLLAFLFPSFVFILLITVFIVFPIHLLLIKTSRFTLFNALLISGIFSLILGAPFDVELNLLFVVFGIMHTFIYWIFTTKIFVIMMLISKYFY